MTFHPVKIQSEIRHTEGTGIGASLRKGNGIHAGRGPTRLFLTIRGSILDQRGWAARTPLNVFMGSGDDAGKIRIQEARAGNDASVVCLRKRSGGQNRQWFELALGQFSQFPDRAINREWCEWRHVDGGIEISLPEWAGAEPQPKAEQPEGPPLSPPNPEAAPGSGESAALILDGRDPATMTRKEQVLACHEAHPDWKAGQIAEHLGISRGSASGILSVMGIRLGGEPPEKQPMEAKAPSKATTPASTPKPSPMASPSAGSVIVTKAPVKPTGKRFYLRDRVTGNYVHQSLNPSRSGGPLLTAERQYAWCDSEARMFKVRQLFPETIDFSEIPSDLGGAQK